MCETHTSECPDDHMSEVQLGSLKSVARGTWEPVMVVVPTFSQAQYPYEPVITAVITRVVVTFTPPMTDRVHSEGDVP